jgi:hypothetical protein
MPISRISSAGCLTTAVSCPAGGYVIRGTVAFLLADREETYEAGDAYYVPPGHGPIHYAGAEIVEFSPTDVLAQTISVVMDNLHAAGVAVRSPE